MNNSAEEIRELKKSNKVARELNQKLQNKNQILNQENKTLFAKIGQAEEWENKYQRELKKQEKTKQELTKEKERGQLLEKRIKELENKEKSGIGSPISTAKEKELNEKIADLENQLKNIYPNYPVILEEEKPENVKKYIAKLEAEKEKANQNFLKLWDMVTPARELALKIAEEEKTEEKEQEQE